MKQKIIIQVVFWLIIGGITFGMTSNIMPLRLASISAIINVFFYAIIFYTNVLYIFPKYYNTESNFKFTIINIAIAICITLIMGFIERSIIKPYIPKFIDIKHPDIMIFLRTFFWMALMIMIGTVNLIQVQLREHVSNVTKISEEKLNTELKLLKSQINPHFLFNALNNIYSLTYLKSDKAPESILELSNMLRYVIDDCANETVNLKSEIEYIENYIAFQKMKSPDKMRVEFNIDEVKHNLKISPLMFIPFIENSFKYSKIEEFPNSYIKMKMATNDNHSLSFSIENSIPPTGKAKSGAGTGIANVKQRLNHIYPGAYSLELEDTANEFKVKLKVRV